MIFCRVKSAMSLPFATNLRIIRLAVCAVTRLQADIITIAAWDFDTQATFLEPSSKAANVSVPTMTYGTATTPVWVDLSEVTINNLNSGITTDFWTKETGTASGGVIRMSKPTGAYELDRYLEFSVTAAPGYVLSLDTLRFDVGGPDTSNGDRRFHVAYSLDGFDESDVYTGQARNNFSNMGAYGFQGAALDFADLPDSFDNFSGTVTFRFYPETSSSGTRNPGIDNIILTGSVIPEPSTALLLGLSGAFLTVVRRLRRR